MFQNIILDTDPAECPRTFIGSRLTIRLGEGPQTTQHEGSKRQDERKREAEKSLKGEKMKKKALGFACFWKRKYILFIL